MSVDNRSAILLTAVSFLKPGERRKILQYCPRYEELLRLRQVDVESVIKRRFRRSRWNPTALQRSVDITMKWLERSDGELLLSGNPRYPQTLDRIYDPPFALYVRGTMTKDRDEWSDVFSRAIAVVGTRNPDRRAEVAAFHLGEEAAEFGLTVVSGLALGIDGAAHRGVVRRGGRAVAVLGSGIDAVYPHRHRDLAVDILHNGGALVSEYPPGVPVQRHHFPARNRIISGLVPTLCVVQAPLRSGALISVEYALEQGRDVWIHREGVTDTLRSEGSRALYLQGASICSSIDDIVGEWAVQDLPSDRRAMVGVRES